MKICDNKQQRFAGRFPNYPEEPLPEIGDALALNHWRTCQRY